MFRILAVDDDREVCQKMEHLLTDAGYDVLLASGAPEGLEVLEHKHIDLIVLDITMPGMDGFGFLSQLRGNGYRQPVLVVSGRKSLNDRVRGLRLGADDYMGKPADEEELLLRIAALLRRCHADTERTLTVGTSRLIYDTFTVEREGTAEIFPKKQFMILYKLLSNPNKTFTRRQLMDEIWDLDTESDEHTVVVHINRLRELLKDNPDFCIVTVRGLGYKGTYLR